jgi:phage-related protein
MHQNWYILSMENSRNPVLTIHFYRSSSGNEPVREWIHGLSKENRKVIGEDMKTVQIGWPLGMPLVRKMESDLWEVRSKLTDCIVRILFTIKDHTMILLHGFKKKSDKTPANDLNTARRRLKNL